MASVDSDVDMSPPTTPTRASPSISLLTSTPTQRSRTLRFRDTDSSQPVLFISGDPFTASNKIPPPEPSGNIMKTTEKASDKARKLVTDRERIAEEYAKSLDETTCYIQELGLGKDIGHLKKALANVIKKFALGEDIMDSYKKSTGLAQSIHATVPGNSSISKPTYAQAMTSYQPNINTANLPSKPIIPVPGQNTQHRRADNRIFVRLPEAHPSRDHHIHAVKAALFNKLGPEGKAVKAIQKAKSGITIVSANEKHANQLIGKAEIITSVLGGKVEKAEEWLTFVITTRVCRK